MGQKLTYFTSKRAPVSVGTGTNVNDLAGISSAKVNVVPLSGPFDKASGETASVSEFWQDQPVVLHMLRRFGCPLCRAGALELSAIKPILDTHGVRLVGVGLGYNSLDGFMEVNCWRGNELYVDEDKVLYDALKLGKNNILGVTDEGMSVKRKEANDLKVGGNLSGDGMSLGGTYVIDKGGKILMEFQQQKFGDHVALPVILKALGIPDEELKNALPVEPQEPLSCSRDQPKCE